MPAELNWSLVDGKGCKELTILGVSSVVGQEAETDRQTDGYRSRGQARFKEEHASGL